MPWSGRLNEKSEGKPLYQRAKKVARKSAPIQPPIYMEIDSDTDEESKPTCEELREKFEYRSLLDEKNMYREKFKE